jgi:hypothetical protein
MTTAVDRDQKSGRFLSGCKPGPGRSLGSRNQLATAFVDDLKTVWNETGITALRRCAEEEPAQFVRVVASLMPKDISVSVGVDAASFGMTFRAAVEALGNEIIEPSRRRPPLPNQRVIDHER